MSATPHLRNPTARRVRPFSTLRGRSRPGRGPVTIAPATRNCSSQTLQRRGLTPRLQTVTPATLLESAFTRTAGCHRLIITLPSTFDSQPPPLSSLQSTLAQLLISVHSKGLTRYPSRLESTLTKNQGEGPRLPSSRLIPIQILFLVLLCWTTKPWRVWREAQRLSQ